MKRLLLVAALVLGLSGCYYTDNDESCITALKLSRPILEAQEKVLLLSGQFDYAVSRHLPTPEFIVQDVSRHQKALNDLHLDIPKLTKMRERYLQLRKECLKANR